METNHRRFIESSCSGEPSLIETEDWPCTDLSCPLTTTVTYRKNNKGEFLVESIVATETCVSRIKLVLTNTETSVVTTLFSAWSNPVELTNP